MKLLDTYLDKKKSFPKYLIIIQSGNFYEVYGEDAFIFNKIFGYKIKKVGSSFRVGFPLIALVKVTTKLKELKINYMTIEKENITKKNFNKNVYDEYANAVDSRTLDIVKEIKEVKEEKIKEDNTDKKIENIQSSSDYSISIRDNFRVVIVIKKFISYIKKPVLNFPNSEKILKDNIINCLYNILELTYYANEIEPRDRRNIQAKILSKIRMLNFYLQESCDKKYISLKKFSISGEYLLDITKGIYGWINSEKIQ